MRIELQRHHRRRERGGTGDDHLEADHERLDLDHHHPEHHDDRQRRQRLGLGPLPHPR
jgi:hypothetical protein